MLSMSIVAVDSKKSCRYSHCKPVSSLLSEQNLTIGDDGICILGLESALLCIPKVSPFYQSLDLLSL